MPFMPKQIRACFAESRRRGKSDAGCRKMARDTPSYRAKGKRKAKSRKPVRRR